MKRLLLLPLTAAALSACSSPASTPSTPAPTPSASYNQQQTERLYGKWSFTYTIVSTWNDKYTLKTLEASTVTPGEYYLSGTNEYGGLVIAGYDGKMAKFSLYDPGSDFDQFYTFNFTNGTNVQGCYYLINHSTNQMSNCYAMNGNRYSTSTASLATQNFTDRQLAQKAEFTPGSANKVDYNQYLEFKALVK